MTNIMAVLLNGIAQLEYDRNRLLPEAQALYLDKIDEKMQAGILVGDEIIQNPNPAQRAQFAAANLARAIRSDDESMAAAMCSYLAIRLPELKQIKIEDNDGEFSIEMVFDEDYRKQVAVQFTGLH